MQQSSDFLISSVEGNRQRLDGGVMFGNAPRAIWEKWIPPDEKGRILLACRALLIEAQGKVLLCETGIGAFFEPKLAERLELIYSQGHTPGQMHCLFRGSAGSIFYAGDLIPGTHWVHLPITMGYGRFHPLEPRKSLNRFPL